MPRTRQIAGLIVAVVLLLGGGLALRRVGVPPVESEGPAVSVAAPVAPRPQEPRPVTGGRISPEPPSEAPTSVAAMGGTVEIECRVPGLIGTGFGILKGSDGDRSGAPYDAGVFRARVASREGSGIFRLAVNGEWEVSWRDDAGVVRCEVAPEAPTWGIQGRALGWDAWPEDTRAVLRGCDGRADIEPDGSFFLERRDPEPCEINVWLRSSGKAATAGPFALAAPSAAGDQLLEIRLPPPSALRRLTDEEVAQLERRIATFEHGCTPDRDCYQLLEEARRELELHRASAGDE